MKLKSILIFISLLVNGPDFFAINNPSTVDKGQIIELTNEYTNLLQKTINQKLDAYIAEMGNCFDDPIKNDHTYDLSNQFEVQFVLAYLSDAQKATNIKSIDIETGEIELLDCIYFDPKTSQQYAYVKIPKTINWSSKKSKTSYINYLSINVTNSAYHIENVLNNSAIVHKKYLAPCLKESLDAKKQQELAKQINTMYDEITSLYSQKKYLDALVIVEFILKLNSEYQNAIDAKEAIISLVSASDMDQVINRLLSSGNISEATKNLEIAKKYDFGDTLKLTAWELKIKQFQDKRKQELNFQKAEHFFKNEMYQNALTIFKKLKQEGYKNERLNQRITACQDSDPRLIQKRILTAYNEAVASKKKYNSTFKTYFKYENSGYLKGTNFHFMCLMMLDNGNKSLLREMGMTSNQSKNLAIKYFYRAREMGIDNKDVEIKVFTKNYNKKWKN